MRATLLPLLLLVACSGDKGTDTSSDAPTDGDGDGYTAIQGDCDDEDPDVHPGAGETAYDGADNDCDPGTLDDDLDGDGAAVAVDCDDDNADIHPGAEETCDGIDDDCDGTVDDDATALDIDEICDNGIDDNCNHSVDDCQLTGARTLEEADASFLGERAGDYAALVGPPVDLDGDGAGEALIAVCADDACSGILYVFSGPLRGALSASDARATISGVEDGAAACQAAAGDLDGDGSSDLVVSRCYGTPGAPELDVLSGPIAGAMTQPDAETHLISDGDIEADILYSQTLEVGDLNDDDIPDVLSGVSYYTNATRDSIAQVTVSYGPLAPGDRSLQEADVLFSLADASIYALGYAASADLDGDGLGDVVIAEPYTTDNAGAVYLESGPLSSESLGDADPWLVGDAPRDFLGGALASAGDADGDGLDDVWIVAWASDENGTDAGSARLFLGSSSSLETSPSAEVLGVEGQEICSATAGDLNGDAHPDLLAGDCIGQSSDLGTVYLVYGPLVGTSTVDDAAAEFISAENGDCTGPGPNYAGDHNGDGVDDVAISAYGLSDFAGGAFFFTTVGL